jgi:hypothetical protein
VTDPADLARRARNIVAGAHEATLLLYDAWHAGPEKTTVYLHEADGRPAFWCPPGSAVAGAAERACAALLRVSTADQPGAVVTLAGLLATAGPGQLGGQEMTIVILKPGQVLIEYRTGGNPDCTRYEVPPGLYADAAPDPLAACGAHLAQHTNAAHQGELRDFVATRQGIPAGTIAGAKLSSLDRYGAQVTWVDLTGAQSMTIRFPWEARSAGELARLLRDQLRGAHRPQSTRRRTELRGCGLELSGRDDPAQFAEGL